MVACAISIGFFLSCGKPEENGGEQKDEEKVESITISQPQLDMLVGEKQQLTADIFPNGLNISIVWKSSNTSVVTVSNGMVSAIAEGEAIITASAGNKIESCKVTVSAVIPDPEGTKEVGLDAGGSKQIDNDIFISSAFNLAGKSSNTYVSPLGSIRALGAIKYIPKDNWAKDAPAKLGYGYVVYSAKNNSFYRLYLKSELPDKSGFYVNYQGPFCGVDQEIELPLKEKTVSSAGCDTVIVFKNTDIIIPASIKSSESWCYVSPATTLAFPFLTNAVKIKVNSTSELNETKAAITITTASNKASQIAITRKGAKPYLNLSSSTLFFDRKGGTKSVSISTNLDVSSLRISNNTAAEWCTAMLESSRVNLAVIANPNASTRSGEITITGEDLTTKLNITQGEGTITISESTISFGSESSSKTISINSSFDSSDLVISGNTASDWCTTSLASKTLSISASANNLSTSRSGVITVKAKSGDCAVSLSVNQKEGYLTLSSSTVSFDNAAGSKSVTISTNLNATSLFVENNSAQEWCTCSLNAKTISLSVHANAVSISRNGTIKIAGKDSDFSAILSITQSGGVLNVSEESVSFDNKSESKSISIESNLDASALSVVSNTASDWCAASLSSKVLKLTVISNPNSSLRTGQIIIKGGELSKTIQISQQPGSLRFNSSSITLDNTKTSRTVSISSNLSISEIEVSNNTASNWCTAAISSNAINISVSANPNFEVRNGKIDLKAKNGTCTASLNVSQSGGILNVSTDALSYEFEGGTQTINLTTNLESDALSISVGNASSWSSASISGKSISLVVSKNTQYNERRSGKLIVSSKSGNMSREVSFDQIMYSAVDLGLSVYWSAYNLNANSPYDAGIQIQWGAIESNSKPSWKNYIWCNGTEKTLTKYNSSSSYGVVDNKKILDLSDDVANVTRGGTWRIPSKEQFEELINNCNIEYKNIDGVHGYLFTSKKEGYTDKSIFIPGRGYYEAQGGVVMPNDIYYWTSTLKAASNAYYFGTSYGEVKVLNEMRDYGYRIRPIATKK